MRFLVLIFMMSSMVAWASAQDVVRSPSPAPSAPPSALTPGTPTTPAPTPLWPRAALRLPSGETLLGTRQGLCLHAAAPHNAPADSLDKDWRTIPLPGEKDDGVIALCQDTLGRLWCGRERSGVTVGVQGKDGAWTFQPYPVGAGPLGSHVSFIACHPETGAVWMVHEYGASIYREFKPPPGRTKAEPPRWSHLNRLTGLPCDHLKCVAFLPGGKVILGIEADGLVVGTDWPVAPRWKAIPGPKDNLGRAIRMPDAPCGAGLPSPIVNAVLTASDGRVFVATDTGLAWSEDGAATFRFVRGQDWKKKVEAIREPRDWRMPPITEMPRSLAHPDVDVHGPYPPVLTPKEPAKGSSKPPDLLPEDYVQSLALDAEGRLWVGTRVAGAQAFDPTFLRALGQATRFKRSSYCDAFVGDGVALRGGGVQPIPTAGLGKTLGSVPVVRIAAVVAPPKDPPPFPATPGAPDLADWHGAMQAVDAFRPRPMAVGDAVALPDDWTTRGDWQGRLGTAYMLQYACCSPHDYMWGDYEPAHGFPYAISHIGTNHKGDDGIRNWCWVGDQSDPRAMEMPNEFIERGRIKEPEWHRNGRRASGTDDHAEAYPWSYDGPHVYIALKVPEGRHVVSLYFMNWDGESPSNCCRDYRLDLRINKNFNTMFKHGFGLEETLATGRVHDWDGGVYKRFLVQGPCRMTLWVDKNHSFNTMVMGTGFQPLTDKFPPYFGDWDAHLAWTKQAPGARPMFPAPLPSDAPRCADFLWRRLDWLETADPASFAAGSAMAFEVLLRHERAWLAAATATRPATGLPAKPPSSEEIHAHQERLARAAHFLGLFLEREAAWEARGWTTPRRIQRTLPWDGTYGPRGNPASVGLRVLKEYLAKHPLPDDQRAPWAGAGTSGK